MNQINSTEALDLISMAERISQLDLDPIKIKLMDAEEGKGWTLQQADEAEKWYKRYLFLCAKYKELPLVPLGDIDTFWHQHILDTRKYPLDCDYVFGHFLHHFPYFGMRGDEDAAALKSAGEETLYLFQHEYGETPFPARAKCNSKCKGCVLTGCTKCKKVSNGFAVDAETRPSLVRQGASFVV